MRRLESDWHNTKVCKGCKKDVLLITFKLDESTDDGYFDYCRPCDPFKKIKSKSDYIFKKALMFKKIMRPAKCEVCGSNSKDYIPRRGNSPRTNIEGHHYDYDKPLNVIWLCVSCHRLQHHGTKEKAELVREKVEMLIIAKYR